MSTEPHQCGWETAPQAAGDPAEGVSTLIDEFLAAQRQVLPAANFSAWHERHTTPSLESYYRELIPLSAPRPGEQYAFEVDLDRCSGCKACVTACHSLNGLDEDESWREVGLLLGEAGAPRPGREPLQQTITTACHHCLEPACLSGCPVLAYDKDPATGIVRHLDDQCIGCSYCVMMCPYEVPRYSAQRGIVRKCDLCHGRLAENEAPACVQACPSQAIKITLVNVAAIRQEIRGLNSDAATACPEPVEGAREWLADAPDPALTLPTTRFLSTKDNRRLLAADHGQPRVAPAHWPLVLMLTLTQSGMGALLAGFHLDAAFAAACALLGFSLGLVASVLHLGQPLKAWRIWLGWRTSWLSREAIALNTFFAIALAVLAMRWGDRTVAGPTGVWATTSGPAWLLTALALLAVLAQTMVYADTRRRFWRTASTLPRFLGTTLIGGLAGALWIQPGPAIAGALVAVTLTKLAGELAVLKHADTDAARWTALRRTAALQRGALRGWLGARFLLGLAGGALLPLAVMAGALPPSAAGAGLMLCLLGELAERVLFFASVSPDKMPGTP